MEKIFATKLHKNISSAFCHILICLQNKDVIESKAQKVTSSVQNSRTKSVSQRQNIK